VPLTATTIAPATSPTHSNATFVECLCMYVLFRRPAAGVKHTSDIP